MREESTSKLRICRFPGASAGSARASRGGALLHGGNVGGVLEDTVDCDEARILAEKKWTLPALRIALFASVCNLYQGASVRKKTGHGRDSASSENLLGQKDLASSLPEIWEPFLRVNWSIQMYH